MLLGGDDAADDDVQRAQLRLQLLIRLQHALQVGSVLSARRVSIAAQPVTLGGDPLVLAAQRVDSGRSASGKGSRGGSPAPNRNRSPAPNRVDRWFAGSPVQIS